MLKTVRHSISRGSSIYLSLILLGLMWVGCLFYLSAEHDRAIERAETHVKYVVKVFQENTDRIFQGIDRSLISIRNGYQDNPNSFDLKHWVKQNVLSDTDVVQFSLIAPDGYMIESTADYAGPPLYLGDREHFIKAAENADDILHVARPVLGRASGRWSIQTSRRLMSTDGRFLGVVVGSVDINVVGRFFQDSQLGSQGSLVLRNRDFVILAVRGPDRFAWVGSKVGAELLRQHLEHAPAGHYWGTGKLDGVVRLIGYSASRDLPLLFTTGTSKDDMFTQYNRTLAFALSLLLSLTAIIAGAIWFDIRQRIRLSGMHGELAQTKAFLNAVIDNMPVPVVVRDPMSRKILHVNRAYEKLLGLEGSELVGTTAFDIFSPEAAQRITVHDTMALSIKDQLVTDPIDVEVKPAGYRTISTTRIAVRGKNDQPQFLIAIIDDVTDRQKNEARIERLAHYDTLTNLANRNLFKVRIDEALGRLNRFGSEFALCMVDLDQFKAVNDTIGHQAGDDLLRQVAERIKQTIRDIDVAARLGGDEFALILLPAEGSLAVGAERLAARLVAALSAPYTVDGDEVSIGCSIGIAQAPQDGNTSDELLKNADLALYKSKTSGRNCFHFFHKQLRSDADTSNRLEADLRQAIWRNEFELFYQPIVDAKTQQIKVMEALIRWRHPTLGLIGPGDFIPLAEDLGLIIHLGEWVIARACQDAAQMPKDIGIAVNLSPVQFAKSNVVDAVVRGLAEAQLAPSRLELEITEGVLLQESAQNIAALQQLKSLGVSIVLDDFGVGYSSLSYLTSFSFDKVKIDRSFVEKLDKPETHAIIASIEGLSRTLHLETCAEGIETEAQLERIRSFGIDLCQGYLFSKPMPLGDLRFDGPLVQQRPAAA